MDYYKIVITSEPVADWLNELLPALLGEVGFESFSQSDEGLEAYIPSKNFNQEDLDNILISYQDTFSFSISKELIKDQNWNEVWEKNYFKPLMIGEKCVIRAPFHTDYPTADFEIVIEPNMAFGTGNHETTSSVIEAILELDLTGKSVLDMGCGTGILGILASMKGASRVVAIDIDEWSFHGATENATLNGIENMEVKLGDASLLGNEYFDVIFANIHKNILLNDMEMYTGILNSGGVLIMSGYYSEDVPEITGKVDELGLSKTGTVLNNNWVAQTFRK